MSTGIRAPLLAAALSLAACGGGSSSPPGATSVPTSAGPVAALTPPTTDAYGSTPPTPQAWGAAQRAAVVPPGWRDCGQDLPTSGWPTTMVLRPDRWDCIVDAAGTGAPAIHSVLARDHHGGVDVTLFEVLGATHARIVSENVGWTGSVASTSEQTCIGFRSPGDYSGPAVCVDS